MDGKDLHVGDFACGILPASAPLAIGALTLAGMALAFAREASGRVAISFIGEGGSSLGEWHEAINLCAARKLPAVFCLENNQTALSTPVREQAAVRVFADKAAGYGIPGVTIDGTDADEIASAVRLGGRAGASGARSGADRAGGDADVRTRASRRHALSRPRHAAVVGVSAPCRLRAMRIATAYAVLVRRAIRSRRYAERLLADGVDRATASWTRWKTEIAALVEREARAVIAADWPDPSRAGAGVAAGEPPRVRVEVLEPAWRQAHRPGSAAPGCRCRAGFRSERRHLSRGHCRGRPRRAGRGPPRVRLRRGCRRRLRQCVPAAAAAARGVRRSHRSTRRSPKARCSASALARPSPGSGRSARCSSTTSSPPASTSW